MTFRNAAVLSVAALLVGVLGSNVAEARPGGRHFQGGGGHSGGSHFRGGHGGGGRALFFAAPIIAGAYLASRYYYPPWYDYPAPAYYPPTPPVYIEQTPAPYSIQPQSEAQPQPQSQAYWYYCSSSQAYYPHVQTCGSGWQRVAPQPPPG